MQSNPPTSGQRVAGGLASAGPVLGFAAGLVALAAPLGAVVALGLITIAAASPCRPASSGARPATSVLAAAALGAYLLVNAAWAESRGAAYGKVLLYCLAVSLAIVGVAAAARRYRGQLDRLALGLLAAIAAGAAYLLVEVTLDQPVARAVAGWVADLRPGLKPAAAADGPAAGSGIDALDRNLAVLCLLLFPALLLVRTLLPSPPARIVAALLSLAAGAMVLTSRHVTSVLALLSAAVTFAGAHLAPGPTRRLIVAGWVIATLLVVPVVLAGHAAGLHQAPWLPEAGRDHLGRWAQVAAAVGTAPILGTGVGGSDRLEERPGPAVARPEGRAYALRTGRASHNIYLQAWSDLGAAGALLLAALGLAVLDALRRLPRRQRPHAYATFVTAMIIGCFGWSLWQAWWMAVCGFTSVALAIALATAEHREQAADDAPGGSDERSWSAAEDGRTSDAA